MFKRGAFQGVLCCSRHIFWSWEYADFCCWLKMMLRPVKVCSGEKRKPNQFQLWMWAHLEWNNFGWLETLLNLELPACCIYQSWIRWFVATGYIWSWNLWGCIRRDFGYNCGQVWNMLIYRCWLNMKLKPGRVFEERWYSICRSWVCRPVVTTPHLPISFACFDSLPSHSGFANHPDGRNCQQQPGSSAQFYIRSVFFRPCDSGS